MTPFERFKKTYQAKKVLVMGLGLLGGGVGVAQFFSEIGAQVTVTDLKSEKDLGTSLKKLEGLKLRFVLGRHEKEDFTSHDLIIRNPAVANDSPFLAVARENKIPVVMDAALFAKFCPAPIIGVTGTRGKTTTATLIYEVLRGAGKQSLLGGNVKGVATLPLLEKLRDNSLVVLELSSWELQGFHEEKISPDVAVITNIYQDHLNRYADMEEYVEDKKAIFQYQAKDDYLVLNKNNPWSAAFAKSAKAKVIWFQASDVPADWRLRLLGKHNQANAAAALKVAQIFKLLPQMARAVLETFRGAAYRLEEVAKIDGVRYINDTTSTTPEATLSALSSFDEPIVLLCGGASKNLDLADLAAAISKRVKAIVLLEGTATDQLSTLINQSGGEEKVKGRFDKLKLAVLAAQKAAKPGDIVLLSPGCASFGMFVNEYDRGEQFNHIVNDLKDGSKG